MLDFTKKSRPQPTTLKTSWRGLRFRTVLLMNILTFVMFVELRVEEQACLEPRVFYTLSMHEFFYLSKH
jgi:hypothetical protein